MVYKDKDRQGQAQRECQRRYRDKDKRRDILIKKGVTVPVGEGRTTSPFRDDTGKEPIDFYNRSTNTDGRRRNEDG